MKIGVDIRILSSGFSGIPNYLLNILGQLQTIDTVNDYFLFAQPGFKYSLTNTRWKIIYTKPHVSMTLFTQFFLPWELRKHKITIFWATEYICPLWNFGRVKFLVSVYDLTFVHYPETMPFKRRWITKILSVLSMRKANKIITISNFIALDILTTFRGTKKSKIVIIPCAAPEWCLPPSYAPEQRGEQLLFIGNFEPRKNILNIIKALELIKAENQLDLKLSIAGSHGWNNAHIHNHIQKSTVNPNISFLGFLESAQLQQELLSCKSLLFPSIYEGFGIPVLEALLLDCIVITSENSAMEEVAENGAIYTDPQKPADIADKILSVYTPDFDRTKYLSNKQRILAKYSWHKNAQLLLNELNQMLADPSRAGAME